MNCNTKSVLFMTQHWCKRNVVLYESENLKIQRKMMYFYQSSHFDLATFASLHITSILQTSRVLKPTNLGKWIFVQLYDLLSWFIFMLMANSGTNGPESIAAAVMARLGPISDKTDKIHREFNFLTKYILNSDSFFFYICLVLTTSCVQLHFCSNRTLTNCVARRIVNDNVVIM